jgi:tripartite-type tricarboxylate transporter receptor subunit TctC
MQRIQSIMKTLVMASTALLLATSGIAHAVVPIKLVVGFSAGSSSDMLARVLAFELEKTLGQPVIVDNRPGASSIIAAEYVARAAPDGNTLLLASNTALVANQYLFKELRYDAAKDLTPIARLTTVPTFLVVGNKVPAQDLKGLIELGKKTRQQPVLRLRQ